MHTLCSTGPNKRKIQLIMVAIGNQLNSETQAHTHEAHKVNLKTNQVSQKMAILNGKSTQAAVESSRTTRINVQVWFSFQQTEQTMLIPASCSLSRHPLYWHCSTLEQRKTYFHSREILERSAMPSASSSAHCLFLRTG